MPWTSFGPWQSHIGPPGAPSWPAVAIFDDLWGHCGVAVELSLGTGGVFLTLAGFRNRKRRVRAGTPNQNRFFIDFGVCPKALRRVLAAAGALFSLWRPVANNGYFGLHFGDIREPKAQLYSLWGLPESILGSKMGCCLKGDFSRISRGRQDSEDVLGGW